jgi:hypothetical protein
MFLLVPPLFLPLTPGFRLNGNDSRFFAEAKMEDVLGKSQDPFRTPSHLLFDMPAQIDYARDMAKKAVSGTPVITLAPAVFRQKPPCWLIPA